MIPSAAMVPLREGMSTAAPDRCAAGTVIVFGSGKGGVGKSVLSSLLAAATARVGRRVLLLDGSQEGGSLHLLLGVRPVGRLASLLAGEVPAENLVVPVRERLSLLPVDATAETFFQLTPTDRARLHLRLTPLFSRFDAVFIDAGPGIESPLRAMLGASRLVVVAAPEPTSLSDAYALIKVATLQVPALPIGVLANRTFAPEQGPAIFERLALAADRFLKRRLDDLGAMPECGPVRDAARTPGGLLELQSTEIDALASRLLPLPAAGRMVGSAKVA